MKKILCTLLVGVVLLVFTAPTIAGETFYKVVEEKVEAPNSNYKLTVKIVYNSVRWEVAQEIVKALELTHDKACTLEIQKEKLNNDDDVYVTWTTANE